MTTGAARQPKRPLRVLFLSWRDQGHPEAGGAEAFLDRVSRHLAAAGHHVTILTARYPGSRRAEVDAGRRFVRRGRRFTVYGAGMAYLLRRRRSYDVVVDVQNGVPFWSPLVTRRPVVNLVHHVHREQWPEVFGPVRARLGWFLESWLSPRVYAGSRYLVVSAATRTELAALGVAPERVDVVYSGRDETTEPIEVAEAPQPRLVVLGRLVPHKRVELAIDALAALAPTHPGLGLDVVGHGYWLPELVRHAERLGVSEKVRFRGFVDLTEKNRLLGRAWVNVLPSLKEGWGLAILEAGALGVTSVAFRQASGTQESVVDGRTGLLVEDQDGFVAAIGSLLDDVELRRRLGRSAAAYAATFTWAATAAEVEILLHRAVSGGEVVALPTRAEVGATGSTGPGEAAG